MVWVPRTWIDPCSWWSDRGPRHEPQCDGDQSDLGQFTLSTLLSILRRAQRFDIHFLGLLAHGFLVGRDGLLVERQSEMRWENSWYANNLQQWWTSRNSRSRTAECSRQRWSRRSDMSVDSNRVPSSQYRTMSDYPRAHTWLKYACHQLKYVEYFQTTNLKLYNLLLVVEFAPQI